MNTKTDPSLLSQRENVAANQPKLTGHTPPLSDCIINNWFAGVPRDELTQLADAAPELLEACKEVEADLLAFNVEDVNVLNVERVGELRGILLAAIAKAQGLSPDSATPARV